MISTAIERAYRKRFERTFGYIYLSVDIHDTIVQSTYKGISNLIYPKALVALKTITAFPEIKVILNSSCYVNDQNKYISMFSNHGIRIDYFNRNPEIENTETGCFDSKFYFDVLLDDKAGFDKDTDWEVVVSSILSCREQYKLK